MDDLENIKAIDKMINTVTFWLAITITIILLVIGIHYTYTLLHYEETNDAQIQENINPVVSRVSGYVKEIRFEENQTVNKGDILAIIEDRKKNIAITALMYGKIGRKLIQQGQFIEANHPIAYIIDKNQGKWVVANFKETQIRNIHIGQIVEITADAFPCQILKGKVFSISPATVTGFSAVPADNSNGNFVKFVQRIPVTISFTGTGTSISQLIMGMSAHVKIKK